MPFRSTTETLELLLEDSLELDLTEALERERLGLSFMSSISFSGVLVSRPMSWPILAIPCAAICSCKGIPIGKTELSALLLLPVLLTSASLLCSLLVVEFSNFCEAVNLVCPGAIGSLSLVVMFMLLDWLLLSSSISGLGPIPVVPSVVEGSIDCLGSWIGWIF